MLPRPISICKVENNNLRIVFRVAGKGTEEFSKMKAGEYLDIQGPLGNGYDLGKIAAEIKAEGRSFDKAILFGGGTPACGDCQFPVRRFYAHADA